MSLRETQGMIGTQLATRPSHLIPCKRRKSEQETTMAERTLELEQPVLTDDAAEAVRAATERAEHAEAELAKLKAHTSSVSTDRLKQPPSPDTAANAAAGLGPAPVERGSAEIDGTLGGEEELRKDPMMAHLLDSLNEGKDVGHYGRLVFAMVSRHFLPHEQVLGYLTKDADFSEEQATAMLRQVEGRDYNPPRRDRLVEWQREQEFQFMDVSDPDSGNLYSNLKFPEAIYEHIENYREAAV